MIKEKRQARRQPLRYTAVWRKPTQIGVKFERSLADAANATLAPKADADASAAPANAEPAKTA